MYKITKVINNNFICSVNEKGEEVILRGPGIGFGKKANDLAAEDKIEKIYSMTSQIALSKLQSLVADIPLIHVEVCTEIIEKIKKDLGKQLNDNIYITLTDHLNFAIERQRMDQEYANAILWEIKKFYPLEFKMGLQALDIVKEKLGVTLKEDEAGFIALHIVNSELDTNMNEMVQITNLIQDILEITKNYYKIEFDEDSLHFSRFITHLKYFGQRIYHNKKVKDNDFHLQKIIKTNYSKDYKCAELIQNYVKDKYHQELTGEEMMFLTLHLKRISFE
ncbi:BglG family transcriptional antiterminator [Mobilisporobacter senegalensis]|uniref:BglG family transcriptional antiterminator n=1 Tax=Mobilisporobacter senegalensis TaxID=1329262 RepID=A0A3N1XI52_9FIRM|nr:PRD domain-containing protein [Mobilisporobacter senegalensis]ROR26374.1 BglG family transcriptional antiterminator [Mobilisporobacter senegalensis]